MIVQAGEEIVVHQNHGTSDYLLVTFCELHNEHLAHTHYFLKPIVEEANISCIGVMNTLKGFYLSSEMDEVFRLVERERRGRKVVVFGQSMGGYAAIKHSRALKADYVLACSPFFSMDPDELEFPSDRHRKILQHSMTHHNVVDRPQFKGMGITAADTQGRVVVFYDPSEFVDVYDADLLRKHLPEGEFVTVPHANHAVYNSSWRATMLSDLVRAMRSEDKQAVVREMNRIRRGNAQFMVRSLRKASQRKPLLCLKALRSRRIAGHPDYRTILNDPFNMLLVYTLFARGDRAAATTHFALVAKEVMKLRAPPVDVGDGPLLDTVLGQKRCLLMSTHGTFLGYEMASRSVRLEPQVFGRSDLFPVFARWSNGASSFYVLSNDHEIPISLNTGDAASNDVVAVAAPQLVEDGANCIAIRNGDGYLSARNNGRLHPSAVLGVQERFIPVPMPEQSNVLKAGSLNWFDQVMLTQPPPAPLIENDMSAARQRRAPRWRRLFARA